MFKRVGFWIIVVVVLIVVGAGGYIYLNRQAGEGDSADSATTFRVAGSDSGAAAVDTSSTVQILPAESIIGEVSASGNIALSSRHYVALGVEGTIARVDVKVGDHVQAGDPLLALDTVELERAVKRAELTVQAQLNQVEELKADTHAADVAVAQAELAAGLENLADVRAGPGSDEVAAARSKLSSAQASYNEMIAGPSQNELTQLEADMAKKEVALAEAQTAYNRIAWRNDVGMTSEASALQQASIDYEAAVAAYNESVAPPIESELQSALNAIQSAEFELDELLQQPTQADIATAEATVVQAQATLDDLQVGANETELRDAQISLEQSLVDLEEAYANLSKSKVSAPIDGTVLAVDAEIGQNGTRGQTVVTLADTTLLELTINVAEADISQVEEGQEAEISIDALPDQPLQGTVSYIAPASDAESDLVNYPVTIRLDAEQPLERVRPGMTAVAIVLNTNSALRDGWLVPTTALQRGEGGVTVTVVRDGVSSAVPVMPSATQGEWTVVSSPELRVGDAVVGTVVSQVEDQQPRFGPPGAGGGQGGGQGGGGGGPVFRGGGGQSSGTGGR